MGYVNYEVTKRMVAYQNRLAKEREARQVRVPSRFMDHLKREAERVASWPEWKRKL